MKKLFPLLLIILMVSCSRNEKNKVPVYAWESGPGEQTDEQLMERFTDYKTKGIDGLMYSAGHNKDEYARLGKIAKDAGLHE